MNCLSGMRVLIKTEVIGAKPYEAIFVQFERNEFGHPAAVVLKEDGTLLIVAFPKVIFDMDSFPGLVGGTEDVSNKEQVSQDRLRGL